MVGLIARKNCRNFSCSKILPPCGKHGGNKIYFVAVMLTALLWAEFALEFETQTALTL